MKPLSDLDRYRDHRGEARLVAFNRRAPIDPERYGVFALVSRTDNAPLKTIASIYFGWDHVSVSRADRCPDWTEMEQVKRLFFRDDECAMQLHVPPAEHVSLHPNVLHLWRPQGFPIPRPPAELIPGCRPR